MIEEYAHQNSRPSTADLDNERKRDSASVESGAQLQERMELIYTYFGRYIPFSQAAPSSLSHIFVCISLRAISRKSLMKRKVLQMDINVR